MLYLSGFHVVETLIVDKPEIIINVYIASGKKDKRSKKIERLADLAKINIDFLDNRILDAFVKHNKHQGYVVHIKSQSFLSEKDFIPILLEPDNSRVLILDSVQDPRNLGACLRSALAFDFNSVIINRDGSAPINEHVYKTSVGAILKLNIFYVTNLSRSINSLKDIGFWVLGLDGNGEGSIFSEKFSSKTAVVMGSEGSGIRKLVKENCDYLIKIPISNKVESLNLSVAAGIIMYELQKQHIN